MLVVATGLLVDLIDLMTPQSPSQNEHDNKNNHQVKN
jgi:hypothetical protein